MANNGVKKSEQPEKFEKCNDFFKNEVRNIVVLSKDLRITDIIKECYTDAASAFIGLLKENSDQFDRPLKLLEYLYGRMDEKLKEIDEKISDAKETKLALGPEITKISKTIHKLQSEYKTLSNRRKLGDLRDPANTFQGVHADKLKAEIDKADNALEEINQKIDMWEAVRDELILKQNIQDEIINNHEMTKDILDALCDEIISSGIAYFHKRWIADGVLNPRAENYLLENTPEGEFVRVDDRFPSGSKQQRAKNKLNNCLSKIEKIVHSVEPEDKIQMLFLKLAYKRYEKILRSSAEAMHRPPVGEMASPKENADSALHIIEVFDNNSKTMLFKAVIDTSRFSKLEKEKVLTAAKKGICAKAKGCDGFKGNINSGYKIKLLGAKGLGDARLGGILYTQDKAWVADPNLTSNSHRASKMNKLCKLESENQAPAYVKKLLRSKG